MLQPVLKCHLLNRPRVKTGLIFFGLIYCTNSLNLYESFWCFKINLPGQIGFVSFRPFQIIREAPAKYPFTFTPFFWPQKLFDMI